MNQGTSAAASRSNASSRVSRKTLEFLDLEAQVDRDDEDEENDEETDDFIVNDNDMDEAIAENPSFHYELEACLRREEDLSFTKTSHPGPESTPRTHSPLPQAGLAAQFEDKPLPKALWAVRCRPHKEFNIVSYTIRHAIATNTTDILSVHYRLDGDGVVYVDTHNPMAAAKILSKCAFVAHSRSAGPYSNVNMRRLDNFDDSVRSLQFPEDTIQHGTWVRLSNPKFGHVRSKPAPAPKPTNPTPFDYVPPSIKPSKAKRLYYHEALAFVLRVSPVSPSTYTILVVPHLDETLAESGVRSPCGPKLGNELLLMDGKNGVDRAKLEELMCKGMHFERGLRVEEVDRRNITTLSKPPSSHEVALFLASEHGHVVASFSRVEQWAFEEGEEVTDWNGTFHGRILTVRDNGLEVQVLRRYADLSGSELEEIVFLGWAAFKQWHVGSYIQHTGGKEGIVVGSEGDNILFWMGGEGPPWSAPSLQSPSR
ncbi:hypothetical protein PQX77_021667 [Marasmius sp. AFHP31]|nr:hypothetical protein PQX77_021667 [Marasmius sp. AFHP31]